MIRDKKNTRFVKFSGFVVLLLLLISCNQEKQSIKTDEGIHLSLAEHIDTTDTFHKQIIEQLNRFLQTKNESYYQNQYWLSSDFEKFYYPFYDIYQAERKDSIANYYQPSLMDIIDTDEENKKLLKIAFIGHNQTSGDHTIKYIYNLISLEKEDKILFSNPLPYLTRNWETVQHGNIRYVISPKKSFNPKEADQQLAMLDKIHRFYNTNPLAITYFSCINPEEVFKIKGFDYNPMMYISKSGGLSAHHNLVFSGRNSEIYTHEILHLYHVDLYPAIPKLINEGMAMYVGGSGSYDYTWHRENFKKFIEENPQTDLSRHLEPFERFYVGEDTSVPYMIGALICERTFRKHGKERLFSLMTGEEEFWNSLSHVGLTKENLDAELKKELQLPVTLCIEP